MGRRGFSFGYFTAAYPTAPIKKVFPTEDVAATITDAVADKSILDYHWLDIRFTPLSSIKVIDDVKLLVLMGKMRNGKCGHREHNIENLLSRGNKWCSREAKPAIFMTDDVFKRMKHVRSIYKHFHFLKKEIIWKMKKARTVSDYCRCRVV
jgi:hypothetical protein